MGSLLDSFSCTQRVLLQRAADHMKACSWRVGRLAGAPLSTLYLPLHSPAGLDVFRFFLLRGALSQKGVLTVVTARFARYG